MSSDWSSGDSDDSRPRPPKAPRQYPPPPPPPKPKSKRKKRPLPPQETINKIWSRFSAQKFSKATAILPSSPRAASQALSSPKVSQSLEPIRDNRLVSEDFERAVEECRIKVRKLVKECKRVNMRYRDPSFDIDWDLKWEKGYCLNGLVQDKFEINRRASANMTSNVPKAVKRVHEIFDNPTFLKDKVSPADVKQGSLGDCWLMASLTALANMEVGIQRICVEYDTKVGIYGFVFHRDGEWIISIVDDKLYLKSPDWDSPSVQRHLLEQTDREDVEKEYRKTYQTGSQSLFFAHCRDQNETWLPLLEKAYAKAHGDFSALHGGWIGEGVEDLTGGVTTELLTSDILDTDEFWEKELLQVNKEFLFGCSTGLLDGGYGNRDGISECHAYVIMEARQLSSGERLLKLRNPWGKGKKGNWEGPWSDGSKEFTPEAQQELNHKFGNDSVFWISYQDLLRKYQHFDRTRLFQDSPDWRVTQEWLGVDVPWKAEFEQLFKIVLRKESPVVLVLSQLDDRYFEGLQGQYSFRLQFRLHEDDSPGEEDYIVRSHGNYLMNRSVVAELKSLKAGTYSVFIMVMADRDLNAASVEDVVKMQCRRKVDNDKLAQVGTAYDLAHSKGAVHMEAKAAVRKAADIAKARESRIAKRRKVWEKRHLGRDILRKQDRKNREKRERRQAREANEENAREERLVKEAKEKEEREPKDKAVQTEDIKEVQFSKADKAVQTGEPVPTISQPVPSAETINDNDKGVQTDRTSESFSESQSASETPKSSSIHSPSRPVILISNRHSGSLPPPPPPGHHNSSSSHNYSRGPITRQYIPSDCESSASPISDFDDMYSEDDTTSKPRPPSHGGSGGSGSKTRDKDSDDENEPEPWNAICIVGFRVYSKDEGLEVKVVMDGVDDKDMREKEEVGIDADIEDGETGVKIDKANSVPVNVEVDIHLDVESEEVDGGGLNPKIEKVDAMTPTVAEATDKQNLPIRSKDGEELAVDKEEKKTSL